jgi:LCP family protein required for cell wall assembly
MQQGRPDEWGYGTPQRQGAGPYDRTAVLPPGGRPGAAGPEPHPGYEWQSQPEPPRRRRRWGRRLFSLLLVLVIALAVVAVLADRRLERTDALADYQGRPAATPGTDWLIVGSDSREGLSAAQKRSLATGDVGGRRTDTIMLLHIPRGVGGDPVLVSLPRDSYVPIPGRGQNKLNAAFSLGGPDLLVRTVENVTGIRVDHYLEIGFGGFAQIVDKVGGVNLCIEKPINDPNAGLNVKAGCQVLNSRKALGYVRTRKGGQGDLDRVERQQQFVGALMDKIASPGVALNPLRSVPLALDGAGALIVDDSDHVHHLGRLAFTLRDISSGGGVTTTVPIGGGATRANAGSVLLWDRPKALALFGALKEDRPVGNDLAPRAGG